MGLVPLTSSWAIHCNTNGSLPAAVEKLLGGGLGSIRISINSCRSDYYDAYYRPHAYHFDDLKLSIQAIKTEGRLMSKAILGQILTSEAGGGKGSSLRLTLWMINLANLF
jgi:hypothetical protein